MVGIYEQTVMDVELLALNHRLSQLHRKSRRKQELENTSRTTTKYLGSVLMTSQRGIAPNLISNHKNAHKTHFRVIANGWGQGQVSEVLAHKAGLHRSDSVRLTSNAELTHSVCTSACIWQSTRAHTDVTDTVNGDANHVGRMICPQKRMIAKDIP
jgi:hypothetical protein